ncbi:putative small proline-rich protein 5 [Onychostruthus taczanowskii]|uniref:putative small proline-rich protein 5 n=1 Tax=Onychostruthus taczanowskii TaxID=356909 RepID=UPI001B8029A4|nr:putative small proline-rich protein 5 [Onychostruthus taczanowskii]
MCSRRSCHSHETSCHESHSSCHDSRPSCHYTIQRQPVQKFTYVTPCCAPVQPCYPPMQRYCPPMQPCCPPVQRYCPPVCPQATKNICKLPPSYPKY